MSVRYALLGLIAQRPRQGYELHQAFEALIGSDGTWVLKQAQTYTTLERLCASGLIEKGADNRIFSITQKGRDNLRAWFMEGVDARHQQDEFFVKIMSCLASGEFDLASLVQTQRALLFKQLHAVTTRREKLDPKKEIAKILLMDKAIMHMEADLRWLDIVEQRLDEVKTQPLPEPERRPRGRPRKGERSIE